jgi:hypothetical protein
VIKENEMGHITHVEETRKKDEKPEEKKQLGRSRHRYEEIKMDLKNWTVRVD